MAEIGFTNTFGHPNRETVNKYLNIPVTSGNTYGGTALPNPGAGPVSYQTDPSPASDDRVSRQGYSGAAPANAGNGTILLKTDGTTSFTMESFDDGGVRLSPAAHAFSLDATGAGVTTNFPPTVIPTINPTVPLSTDTVTVQAMVNDREDPITSVTLTYALNGAAQAPETMTLNAGFYEATIAAQPDGTRVDYTVTATAGGKSTSFSSGYFAGITPISTLRVLDGLGEPLYLDYAARIQGTATSDTNVFSVGTNDDYVQDATGGINIWRTIQPTGAGGAVDRKRDHLHRRGPHRRAGRQVPPRSDAAVRLPHHALHDHRDRQQHHHAGDQNHRSDQRQSGVAGSAARPDQQLHSDLRDDSRLRGRRRVPHHQRRHRLVPAQDRQGHQHPGHGHAEWRLHRHRHHPAGRFPSSVRLRLRHRPAQPRRPRWQRPSPARASSASPTARIDVDGSGNAPGDYVPDLLNQNRARPGRGDVDQLPRQQRQRHRVLHSGSDRRRRHLQHGANALVQHRRQRRRHRHRQAVQWADGDRSGRDDEQPRSPRSRHAAGRHAATGHRLAARRQRCRRAARKGR